MTEPEKTTPNLGGILEYKPQWSLTWKGWLLLALIGALIFWFTVTRVQGFLAIQKPIKADALLIEGWVDDRVIEGAIEEFYRGDYRSIIVTGMPFYRGGYLREYKNQAEAITATLVKLGIPPDRILPVSIPEVKKDRTAAMALGVKEKLFQEKLKIRSINIYSFDVHTRRSYLIYQRVLKPRIRVGAIAHPNTGYDPDRWWTSSTGFRSVIEEAIAYIYARFLWHP